MKALLAIIMVSSVLAAAGCETSGMGEAAPGAAPGASSTSGWQDDFGLAARRLASSGRNPYFILEPGHRLVFESDDARLVITVLDDTVNVDGIVARVVEEREWEDGQLIEVSRNFFAIDPETGDVFYFGEDVDDYKDNAIVGHGGAWRAGEDGARAGLMMPGTPRVGMRYYQEIAPGVAMDRAEVVRLDAEIGTPAGMFQKCLLTQEGSALKPAEKETKIYAKGIGLLRDGDMLLVSYGHGGA